MVSLTNILTLSKDTNISTSSNDLLVNSYSSAGISMSSNDLTTNPYSKVMASVASISTLSENPSTATSAR